MFLEISNILESKRPYLLFNEVTNYMLRYLLMLRINNRFALHNLLYLPTTQLLYCAITVLQGEHVCNVYVVLQTGLPALIPLELTFKVVVVGSSVKALFNHYTVLLYFKTVESFSPRRYEIQAEIT